MVSLVCFTHLARANLALRLVLLLLGRWPLISHIGRPEEADSLPTSGLLNSVTKAWYISKQRQHFIDFAAIGEQSLAPFQSMSWTVEEEILPGPLVV